MGEFGIEGRRYYRKGGHDRTHQIHAFKVGDSNILRHIAFRDYLRHHPEVRKADADAAAEWGLASPMGSRMLTGNTDHHEELERELGLSDIVKLASNENPVGPSAKVAAAIESAMGDLSRYPDGSNFLLKQSLSKFLGVETSQLTIGNGSNDVLELLARVFLSKENESII